MHHLTLKFHQRAPHETIYGHAEKGVSGILGPIFLTHNVPMYVRLGQKTSNGEETFGDGKKINSCLQGDSHYYRFFEAVWTCRSLK